METIKIGSSGSSVKTLLRILGLVQDGIFGQNTLKAVKIWQLKNGLIPDGIVGPKSWTILLKTSTNSSKQIDSSVVYSPLNVHITSSPNRPIKYLAIHFTAGSNSLQGKALSTKHVFETRLASADFCVDDKTMVLFNPDIPNYYCWAVGDKKNNYSSGGNLYGVATNKNTVSIEICSTCVPATSKAVSASNHSGWSFSEAVLNNAATLAKLIMKKYNIPLERVVRHYDISGKLCPGLIGWNDELIYTIEGAKTGLKSNSDKWIEFKNRLK